MNQANFSPSTTKSNSEPAVLKPYQEWDAGEGCPVGTDPRCLTVAELNALGRHKRPLLRAIRGLCIDCSGGSPGEVRHCAMVACPFWPDRMGSNPFVSREMTPEQRENSAARLRASHGDPPGSAVQEAARPSASSSS
jgi:hypothetical protein